MQKRLIKNSSVVKTYEGLTVNADLPEQLFSFTDRINEKKKRWIIMKKKITELLGKRKQIQFKEKTQNFIKTLKANAKFPICVLCGFFVAACFVTVFVCFWSTFFNTLLQVSKYREQSPHHSYTEEEISLSWKELSFTQNSLNQCIDTRHQHNISLCHCLKEDKRKYVSIVWHFTGHTNTGLTACSQVSHYQCSSFV